MSYQLFGLIVLLVAFVAGSIWYLARCMYWHARFSRVSRDLQALRQEVQWAEDVKRRIGMDIKRTENTNRQVNP